MVMIFLFLSDDRQNFTGCHGRLHVLGLELSWFELNARRSKRNKKSEEKNATALRRYEAAGWTGAGAFE